MIMRITWGKLRANSWRDFEKTYRATVAVKGRRLKGLRGRWLLRDTADKNTGFAVSLWESAGAMRAYEKSALYRTEFAPALQPFFIGNYKTYRSEVRFMQQRPAPRATAKPKRRARIAKRRTRRSR